MLDMQQEKDFDSFVHVLLSTYNGEVYLKEQLDSIFAQSFSHFRLFIRDDGSSDNTLGILSSYLEEHPEAARKTAVLSDDPEHPERKNANLGYMGSFWRLLEAVPDAKYYAFSDQDDVWFPEKLERCVRLLDSPDEPVPHLGFSSYYYTDENLQILHPAPEPNMPLELRDVMFYVPIFGFSMVFNHRLRQEALKTTDRTDLPHDTWLQMIAAGLGKISYESTPLAYYRRHGAAVTKSNASLTAAIRNWLSREIFGNYMKTRHFMMERFWQEHGMECSPNDQEFLRLYLNRPLTPSIWFRRFAYRKPLRPSKGGDLALRILFFLNRW